MTVTFMCGCDRFPPRCPPTLRKQLNERTGTLPMLSLPERRVRLGLGLGLANPNPNPNPDSTPTLTPTPIPTLTPTLITPGAGRGHGGGTLLLLTRRPRRALDREDRQEAGGAPAWSLTKRPPWAGTELGPCASSGRAWPLWAAQHSQGKILAHWAVSHRLGCSSQPPPK